MKKHASEILSTAAVCVFVTMAMSNPARGDVVSVVGVDKTDSLARSMGLTVCQVEAVFSSSSDTLISVGDSSITTNDANGFWQHAFGTDKAPSQALITLYPPLRHDSFVTIGLAVDNGSNTTALDPDWNSTLFNTTGDTAGGWFCTPTSGQGTPNANLRVLIAQLPVRRNYGISGSVTVYYNDGATPFAASFQCFGGAGAQGGGPNGPEGPSGPDGAGEPEGSGGGETCTPPDCCGCPGTINCLDPNGSPTPIPCCNCAPCCEAVCALDSFCCSAMWDDNCAATATDHLSACLPDCQPNFVPDSCDIANGTSTDCDENGIPDECEGFVDCQPNGVIDSCDIANGTSMDCNEDLVPDECQPAPPPAEDCNANGIVDGCEVRYPGPLFLSGHDADDFVHCETAQACGGLYPALLKYAVDHSRIVLDPPGPPKILVIGVNGEQSDAGVAIIAWNLAPNGPNATLEFVTAITGPTTPNIATVNFEDFSAVYIPSSVGDTSGGITEGQLGALNARQPDLDEYIDVVGGGLLALTEAGAAGAYGWLPVPIQTTTIPDDPQACPTDRLDEIPGHTVANCAQISPASYHNIFTGPAGYLDLSILARRAATGDPVLLGRLASSSLIASGDCDNNDVLDVCEFCPWDINHSGTVNASDLALLLGAWGPCDPPCTAGVDSCDCFADFNDSCGVSASDLALLLGGWGACTP